MKNLTDPSLSPSLSLSPLKKSLSLSPSPSPRRGKPKYLSLFVSPQPRSENPNGIDPPTLSFHLSVAPLTAVVSPHSDWSRFLHATHLTKTLKLQPEDNRLPPTLIFLFSETPHAEEAWSSLLVAVHRYNP